jgi:hypothetical protein
MQGKASKPIIRRNTIKYCRASAIITYLDVDAHIIGNEMLINDIGIEIQNNKSIILDNYIQKSHENGIKVVGDDNNTRAKPHIWRNKIESCGYNGIVC